MPGMTQTAHNPRQLVGGSFPIRFATVTIAEGEVLAAGSVLGEVTASSEHKLSVAAADDGSQAPITVLWEDVDATGGPVEAEVMLTGDLRAAALTLGEGHTVESVRKALRRWSLFVH
ncbi:head decoration protein [Vreelandella populi]|uniref:head decoration protein n=1 Tax=Vreelandella populi TaxID=2498858 RepID=UPI000F8E6EF0|nr:head decoration protein [Halomonas populi]RUR51412.1 head decoration protein [Halomonas populi]